MVAAVENRAIQIIPKENTTGPATTQVSLKRFEENLTDSLFCRVHRSYIVSLSHISYIERKRIRIGDELIPISDSYLPALMGRLALQE